MSDGEFDLSALEGGDDDDTDDDPLEEIPDTEYELSDNVVEDLVEYSRSCMVHNEEQLILTTLGYATGYFQNNSHFLSGVLIGTAGSGKSRLQGKVEKLFLDRLLYKATTGSDKSFIYDGTWEDARIASLDELQKPSEELIEFLKGVHGAEDEQFRYKVTGEGDGADRDVDEIIRSAKPYWFLYAQSSGNADFELWDRLMKIPVYESRDKNKGVGAMHFDWEEIVLENAEHEYIYEFDDGIAALREHFATMPSNAWVKLPEWVWPTVEPIFDHNRSESNRIYAMIANLIRASCLLNYKNREYRTEYFQGDGAHEAYVAEPQDVANVLACRQTILATTHYLDRKKKAICTAIKETGGATNEASIQDIMDYLNDSNAPTLKRPELEKVLGELADNYFVEKHERAGPNGSHLYEFKGWSKIDFPNIDEDRFADCTDPITGETFIESHRNHIETIMPSAEDFESPETEVKSNSSGDSGQATLGTPTDTSPLDDLDPHEESIRQALARGIHGATIDEDAEDDVKLPQMLGIADLEDDALDADVEGTILDPDHETWDEKGKPDDWVETDADARMETVNAIQRLFERGIVTKEINDDGTFTFSVHQRDDATPSDKAPA